MSDSLTPSLEETGLFRGYISEGRFSQPLNFYYGLNISQRSEWEPIDQLDGILIARRIQDWNKQTYDNSGSFYPYIAGIYNILNSYYTLRTGLGKDFTDKIKDLEYRKTQMWQRLLRKYNVNGTSLSGVGLWQSNEYWNCVQRVLDVLSNDGTLVDCLPKQTSEKNPFEVVRVIDFPWNEITDVNLRFSGETRYWPLKVMYVIAEIAEAAYLKKKNQVTAKLSPERTEDLYDKYISQFMGIARMNQPTKFTRDWKLMDVTPYIGTEYQLDSRILLSDNSNSVRDKRLYRDLESDGPFLRALKIAVESARALGRTPLNIDGIDLYVGSDVKGKLKRISEDRLIKTGSRIIEEFAISPLKESIDYV